METTNLNVAGVPSLLMWLFVHPFLAFSAFCFLVLSVCCTIIDVAKALGKEG